VVGIVAFPITKSLKSYVKGMLNIHLFTLFSVIPFKTTH
jgi:hypothetical protein